MKFSEKELKDLFIAWIIISLAFAILFQGGISLSFNFLLVFLISSLTAGLGFLFHELMHKSLAQKYHLWAEFRAFYNMLFLSLLFSFFGFIIAAPGAVFIKGKLNREKNGKISLAGPLSNIFLALIFFLLLFFLSPSGILKTFLSIGIQINSLLAAFNFIPFGSFDGRKIFEWNKIIYTITLIFALFLYFSRFFLSSLY